jgi:glycoside/pentoside/hexuronide:cation symporter, GPH family
MRGPQGEARLPLGQLIGLGAPALPMAMVLLAAYVYLPRFYAAEFGVDLALVGAALFATRLFDVATDPVVGWASDRWRTRFGRRLPWIVLGAPIVALAIYMLLAPAGRPGGAYLLFWALALTLGWTFVTVPLAAWGAERSPFYHQRTRVSAWRQGFGIVGTVAAIVLAALPGAGLGVSAAEAMRYVAFAAIGLLPLSLLLLARVPDPRGAAAPAPGTGWRDGLAVLAGNRPLRRLLAAGFVNALANGLPGTLFLLYVAEILKLGEAEAGLFLLAYFAAAAASLPAWLGVSYRLGKHRAWSAAMALAIAAFAVVPFLGAGDFWPFLAMSVLTGAALGGDLAFPAAIQADVVDADAAKAGAPPRAGFVLALNQMAAKIGLALAIGLAFPILDAVGFKAAGGNDGAARATLVGLYAVGPLALKLVALALVWRFPLDEGVQAALRRRLVPGD